MRTMQRDIIDGGDCGILQGSVMEGWWDGALSLEYFSVGSVVVYESEWIGNLYVFVCHY